MLIFLCQELLQVWQPWRSHQGLSSLGLSHLVCGSNIIGSSTFTAPYYRLKVRTCVLLLYQFYISLFSKSHMCSKCMEALNCFSRTYMLTAPRSPIWRSQCRTVCCAALGDALGDDGPYSVRGTKTEPSRTSAHSKSPASRWWQCPSGKTCRLYI